MNTQYDVAHQEDKNRGRFFIDLGTGHEAEMTYVRDGDVMIVDHTGVPKAFEGQGIAAQLVVAGVAFARKNNRKIKPVCPYVVVKFQRHKEWADVLAG